MTLKLKDTYFKFNTDTLDSVRKEYNLGKPGAMDHAIDTLQEWAQKQDHLTKKEFSRRYLESFIIASKGSIEKSKTKIDRVCTARTTVSHFFEKCHSKNDFPMMRDFFINFPMPSLMEDNYRIHIFQLRTKTFTPAKFLETMQQCMIIAEYHKLHDYVKGYYLIADLNDVNVMDVITNINIVDLRNCLDVLMEAYGFRMQSIYIISTSNVAKTFVRILKQFLSAKIGERIRLLKTPESLYDYLPKKYLPADFGGDEKSILELYDEFNEELCSLQHEEHMKTMKLVRTVEELRHSEQFNNESFGISGSFKTLDID